MRVDIEPGREAPRPALRRVRAVVADDDAAMRTVVAEVLRLDGYHVDEVTNGLDLLFHVSRASAAGAGAAAIDLIVTDMEMPYCTGLDVLRKIRTGRRATPLVLMTGGGDEALASSVAGLGGRLLEKPFTFGELRSAIAEVRGLAPARGRAVRY